MIRRLGFPGEYLRLCGDGCKRMPVVAAILMILLIVTGTADAANLVAAKRAGKYDIEIRINRNPPILGTNQLEIEIRDAGGGTVSDATVLVNYYMPPMPRMVPMNYRCDAVFKEGKYRTTMNIIMSGPWIIAVKITRKTEAVTAKFNISVP